MYVCTYIYTMTSHDSALSLCPKCDIHCDRDHDRDYRGSRRIKSFESGERDPMAP